MLEAYPPAARILPQTEGSFQIRTPYLRSAFVSFNSGFSASGPQARKRSNLGLPKLSIYIASMYCLIHVDLVGQGSPDLYEDSMEGLYDQYPDIVLKRRPASITSKTWVDPCWGKEPLFFFPCGDEIGGLVQWMNFNFPGFKYVASHVTQIGCLELRPNALATSKPEPRPRPMRNPMVVPSSLYAGKSSKQL
jgi:hypothetical protein